MTNKAFEFNIPVFILAFLGGVIYVTFIDYPKPKAVIKYPTPYNVDKNVYKGLSDECYKFDVKEVECKGNTVPQPII